ncbi:hypothetical protein JTB14_002537 [Gonioctena quinquepunctata]|nr:hypothetical protein JTB14_002537 [Gonioctena quinquepunctata]
MDEQQVIWEGHTIVDPETNNIDTIYSSHAIGGSETGDESPSIPTNGKQKSILKNKKKIPIKKKKKGEGGLTSDPTKLEESASQSLQKANMTCT